MAGICYPYFFNIPLAYVPARVLGLETTSLVFPLGYMEYQGSYASLGMRGSFLMRYICDHSDQHRIWHSTQDLYYQHSKHWLTTLVTLTLLDSLTSGDA